MEEEKTKERKKYKQNPKIVVLKETKERLDKINNKDTTYNNIIVKLLDIYEELLSKN